jgi:predicted lipoprotein with Yx(FWY)xxD motif
MRQTVRLFVAALVASVLLAACGSSSSSSPATTASTLAATSKPTLVTLASNATLHSTVLVNVHGMTLYHLSGEGAGKWICTSSACVSVWHPLVAPGGGVSEGLVGSLGTVTRPDGTLQVTYKGMPLYTFADDTSPGDIKGQGIKDVGTWTVVTIAAPGAATASSSSSASASAAGGGSSGY